MRLWLLYTISLISIVVSAAGLFPFSPLSVNPALFLLPGLIIPNIHALTFNLTSIPSSVAILTNSSSFLFCQFLVECHKLWV